MRSEGVKAEDANLDKIIAAGMTPTPKARFDNSILADPPKEEKKANIKADPNAAPENTPAK